MMEKQKTVLLSTGGTGGHIFPALAVAKSVRERYPDVRILFIGSCAGPEAKILSEAGYEFRGLSVRGVMGRGLKGIMGALSLCSAFFSALGILWKEKPVAVMGFGGYAALASVMAAVFLRIPSAIHEQNAVLGKSNRLLSFFVKKIFISFPEIKGLYSTKVHYTGNPVRAEIATLCAQDSEIEIKETPNSLQKSTRLLVLGGSLGAKSLNDAVIALTPKLRGLVELRHQTGAADYQRVADAYITEQSTDFVAEAFISDMAAAYQWADIVLCRAGGSSLAELSLCGKAAILVPFPYATHNHQWYNAEYFRERGAAILLDQRDFPSFEAFSHEIFLHISTLVGSPATRKSLEQKMLSLAKPHAASELADALVKAFA